MSLLVTKRKWLQSRINSLSAELRKLQEECSHPNAEKTPKASTGNYDPLDDCYWLECHCPDCDKHWQEDQ